jgi:HEPN domain-containing protein
MHVNRKAPEWTSKAEEDLEDSKADYNDGRYANSVFHAESCAQKSLKGLIVAQGFEPEKLKDQLARAWRVVRVLYVCF